MSRLNVYINNIPQKAQPW